MCGTFVSPAPMKDVSIKPISAIFLQAVTVLIGIGTLAFLLWEPNVEGVNANATFFEVYFDDPFLAYAYIASTPFFVALFQVFTLLGYAGRNELFSNRSVHALRTIKICAMMSIIFIVGGVAFLLSGESDDRPPILMMGTVATLVSIIIATVAGMVERNVKSAVEMKFTSTAD